MSDVYGIEPVIENRTRRYALALAAAAVFTLLIGVAVSLEGPETATVGVLPWPEMAAASYESSQLGRIVSLGGRLADPQALSRYDYVRDNPTGLTDRTGPHFYLTCTETKHNASTCQQVNNGGQKIFVEGRTTHGQFTATVIGNGANGDLADQNGNQYTGSFSQNGVSFTSDDGKGVTSNGVFASGGSSTMLSGSGLFEGFIAVFNDNCGGTCIASGAIFGTRAQFAALKARLLHNPGLDAIDLFHNTFFGLGPQNYREGNSTGPDPHLISRGRTENHGYDQFHYDDSYPYVTVPGFLDHLGSAFASIGHTLADPQELPPPPTSIP